MNWQIAVDRTVSGLGYELVDLERSGGGLLRVFIDRLAGRSYPDGGQAVTVEDCEAVTRQLQHVLEVENFDYARLEVSSPGLDRPLKKPQDYARFAGSEVDVTLRMPVDGRKKFRGRLLAEGDAWRVVFNDGKGDQALDFTLDEVRETRLVPVLDFKGRKGKALAEPTDGGRKE
jgi:ribosome maturation factor RimP